jgi:hypothetical protein
MSLLNSTRSGVLYQNKGSISLPFILFMKFYEFQILSARKPGLKIIIPGFRSDERKWKALTIDTTTISSFG